MPGFLISLEGIDNSGKTTQAKKLFNYLKQKRLGVILVREPGGTKTSEKIRKILLDRENQLSPATELFLYLAARSQLVSEVILPALKKNKIVICDRYFDSSLAYQGYARGLDINLVNYFQKRFFCIPDLTILIDIPVKLSQKRFQQNRSVADRLEKEKISFHQKVRDGYLKIALKNPNRIKLISGQGDISQTWGKIKKIIDSFLESKV